LAESLHPGPAAVAQVVADQGAIQADQAQVDIPLELTDPHTLTTLPITVIFRLIFRLL